MGKFKGMFGYEVILMVVEKEEHMVIGIVTKCGSGHKSQG